MRNKPVPVVAQPQASQGIALLMGMGTGKSLCVVSLLNIIKPKLTLIICPVSVIGVWPREIERHSEGIFSVNPLKNKMVSKNTVADKAELLEDILARDLPDDVIGKVIIVNYESAWREPLASLILKTQWDLTVLDEVHKIKSPDAKASKFCHKLSKNSTRRLGLTGTEQPHSPLDVFSQFKFLNPEILGNSFGAFKRRYAVLNQWNDAVRFINLEDLKTKIDSISYRASEDVVELPEAVHVRIDTDIIGEALRLHESILDGMWAELAEQSENGATEAVLATVVVAQLTRCAQVTGGFVGGVVQLSPNGDPLDPPEIRRITGASKKQALEDIVDSIDFVTPRSDSSTEKLVVFCRFKEELNQIKEVALKYKKTYGEISGRDKSGLTENATMDLSKEIVGVQLQAGGVGIDLTAARYVVYWSKDFSFGNYEQSLKRAHRPGQKHPVTFFHFVAPNTIDEKIEDSLVSKESVVQYFRKKYDEKKLEAEAAKGDS